MGISWENRNQIGWLRGFYQTLLDSLIRPVEFFDQINKSEGLFNPLLYAIILNFLTTILAASVQFNLPWQSDMFSSAPLSVGFIIFFAILFSPVFTIISSFIGAGILHVCLMITGGANKTFETTFRVICYAMGPNVISIIPICGGIISMFWTVTLQIVGLKIAHETDTWRAVVAVLLPLVCCCFLVTLFIVSMLGFMGYMQSR